MKVVDSFFDAVMVFELEKFFDHRGYFFEAYNKSKLRECGIESDFVQDNFSFSVKNTIRGLHLQLPPFEQAKLCQVLFGDVRDVFVDLRKNSATWGEYAEIRLSEEKNQLLYIPEGFAHGFEVISNSALFHYKCNRRYNPDSEVTLSLFDSALSINWVSANPIISEKDRNGLELDKVKNLIYKAEK